jgi:hypothetical protein
MSELLELIEAAFDQVALQKARAKHRRCALSQKAGQTVLVPAIGARARVFVWKILPGSAVGT